MSEGDAKNYASEIGAVFILTFACFGAVIYVLLLSLCC